MLNWNEPKNAQIDTLSTKNLTIKQFWIVVSWNISAPQKKFVRADPVLNLGEFPCSTRTYVMFNSTLVIMNEFTNYKRQTKFKPQLSSKFTKSSQISSSAWNMNPSLVYFLMADYGVLIFSFQSWEIEPFLYFAGLDKMVTFI